MTKGKKKRSISILLRGQKVPEELEKADPEKTGQDSQREAEAKEK